MLQAIELSNTIQGILFLFMWFGAALLAVAFVSLLNWRNDD